MKELFKLSDQAKKLLSNNTGYSIKSWFLYGVTIVGLALLIVVGFVMMWDVLQDGKVESDISNIAEVITAIAGLFVAAGLPKIVGEIMERRKNNDKAGTDTEN
jgi:MFS-type transporter involved in bile tolerance (Atg22 family)